MACVPNSGDGDARYCVSTGKVCTPAGDWLGLIRCPVRSDAARCLMMPLRQSQGRPSETAVYSPLLSCVNTLPLTCFSVKGKPFQRRIIPPFTTPLCRKGLHRSRVTPLRERSRLTHAQTQGRREMKKTTWKRKACLTFLPSPLLIPASLRLCVNHNTPAEWPEPSKATLTDL